jgi:hypothetical protein
MDNAGTATLHMDYCLPETAPAHGDDRLRLAGTKGVAEYMAATGVTVATSAAKPSRVQELPPAQSVFVEFLEHVYNGKAPSLTVPEIYAACDATIAAHEAALKRTVVAVG